MDIINEVFLNLNTWLVMLVTGVVVWAVRQVVSQKIEEHRIWKVLLRIVPVGLGAGIALIPGLRPIADNIAQSAAVGLIGGSFSTTAYDVIRESISSRMRLAIGSKAARVKASVPPAPVAPPASSDDAGGQG